MAVTVTSVRLPDGLLSCRIHCVLSSLCFSRAVYLWCFQIVFRFCHSFFLSRILWLLRGYWLLATGGSDRYLINHYYYYYWSNETAIINKKPKSFGRLASHKSKLKSKVFDGRRRRRRFEHMFSSFEPIRWPFRASVPPPQPDNVSSK